MKNKVFAIFLSLSFFLCLFASKVSAGGFQLKTIGALDMDGVTISHIWYLNGSCSITGLAEAYSDIKVKVDQNAEETVSANSDGTWIYHANLASGDHSLTFTDKNGSVISKTLTIGNIPENIGALPKAETPTVGEITPTAVMFFGGLFFLFVSFLLLRRGRFSTKRA